MSRSCNVFALVALLLSAMPLIASCNPKHGLRLNATIENNELVAVLTNTNSHSVRTVGRHVTPFPGSGGFYVKVQNSNGASIKYCGMIDGANPTEQWLGPSEKLVYRDTVRSLTNQYCLGPGKYIGHVEYYNSLPFGNTAYSKPVVSGAFEFMVPTNKSGPKAMDKTGGDDKLGASAVQAAASR